MCWRRSDLAGNLCDESFRTPATVRSRATRCARRRQTRALSRTPAVPPVASAHEEYVHIRLWNKPDPLETGFSVIFLARFVPGCRPISNPLGTNRPYPHFRQAKSVQRIHSDALDVNRPVPSRVRPLVNPLHLYMNSYPPSNEFFGGLVVWAILKLFFPLIVVSKRSPRRRGPPIASVQGCLAHKKTPNLLGPPYEPRPRPTVGS